MEGKSNRIDFNISAARKAIRKIRHYSHKKLVNQLNLYSRLAKRETQRKDIWHIKDDYSHRKIIRDRKDRIHIKHFDDFYERDMHTEQQKKDLETVQKDEEKRDVAKTIDKAKALYRHYGLSQMYKAKLFRENVKSKSKMIERDDR